MSSKWHWTDILGVHQSKEKSGSEDRPTGYGWTYKEADENLEKKKEEQKKSK